MNNTNGIKKFQDGFRKDYKEVDNILKVAIKREITELNAEYNHAMQSHINKETKSRMLHDITGRALTIRRIINQLPSSFSSLYKELEDITHKALQNMN